HETVADACGAGVDVLRQDGERVLAGNVRVVDTCVRGNEALSRLRDEDALGSKNANALVQHDLHGARIRLGDEPLRDLLRLRARLHVVEPHDAALGLRDDLLRDDDDVAVAQVGARRDQVRKVVARMDLGQALDAEDLDAPHTARRRRARSAGSSRSRAKAGDSCRMNGTPRAFASRRNSASESPPKCRPMTPGGRRYSAFVPPRPIAGAAMATGPWTADA